MRWIPAHLSAILAGSLVIMMGMEALVFGSILGGAGKWLGGMLIWFLIGAATMPVGFVIRYIVGKTPFDPRLASVVVGAAVGLAMIPLLHPAMARGISWSTSGWALFLIHGLAGVIGGLAWYGIEFKALTSHNEKR